MFVRLAAVALFVLPAVMAVPTYPTASDSCSGGEVMCCNQVSGSEPSVNQGLAGVLGLALGALDLPVDVSCNPISVLGAGGQSCTGQVACCNHNEVNALVSLQCTPVNVNV